MGPGYKLEIQNWSEYFSKFGEIRSKLNNITLHGSYIICDTGANSD